MQAIIFGAGKIARGFIGHLLHVSSIPFVLVEKNRELVDLLNRRGTYHVEVMGNPERNAEIGGIRAIGLDDHDAIAEAWAAAPVAFTCVGGKNLDGLSGHLSQILTKRLARTSSVTNLITCENWKEPASLLREGIIRRGAAHSISSCGFSEAVIMRSAVEPTAEQLSQDPLWVNVQDYWDLPVDRTRIQGDPLSINSVCYIDGFAGFLERKFYTYNAANGTAAYLGYLKNHQYMFEAANDPWIVSNLKGVYAETSRALVIKYGITSEMQDDLAASSFRKLQDRCIIDYIERNARDPLRKLGPDDRLVGSARMVMSTGAEPRHLARSIAAAIHYANPDDPSARELVSLRENEGIDFVLHKVCRMKLDEPLALMVKNAAEGLKEEGFL